MANFSPLEKAVLKTVAYVDMFHYPLTATEIHHYLVGQPATLTEVEAVLADGNLRSEHLIEYQGYYMLPERQEIVAIRQERQAIAARLWPVAIRYGRLISRLPFVRMVAVTGSLAVDNAEDGADIDYLIVTMPGRLWLCRALVIGIVRLAARRGIVLCPNYFLSEEALFFSEHNLYTAHELVQMVPLSGQAVYQQMWQLNHWVNEFLPNVGEMGETTAVRQRWQPLRRLAELALRTPPGTWLEKWEMERKIRKFSRHTTAEETAFSPDWCKGHFDDHGQQALKAFTDQWYEIELER